MKCLKDPFAQSKISLVLTVLYSLSLSSCLPPTASLEKRIESPGLAESNFIDDILNSVNHYRGLQDARNLTWSPELALAAFSWAKQCNFTTTSAESVGETVGESIVADMTSPYDVLTTGVDKIVETWYIDRLFYDSVGRTDGGVQAKLAHQYTQLVWKASTHIGCSWSTSSCNSTDQPHTVYLICKYDPPGNEPGRFKGNVSCNDCKSDHNDFQLERDNSNSLEDMHSTLLNVKRVADLASMQESADSPECNANEGWRCLIEENFYAAREKNNVSDSHWSTTLASLAQADAGTCTLHKTATTPGVEVAFMETLSNETNVNYTVTWDAIHAWQRSTYLNAQPDYANVIDDSMKYFGCGLAHCEGRTYVLNCVFSPWYNPAVFFNKRINTAVDLQSPDFEINNKTGNFFATLRRDQGLPLDTISLQLYPGLTKQTMYHAQDCNSFVPGTNEVWSKTSLSSISNMSSPWQEVLSAAEAKWYISRFAGTPTEPAARTEYALIVDPKSKYYSCSWSDCHKGTANESIQLVCAFSQNANASISGSIMPVLTIRDIKPFDLMGNASLVFNALRKIASKDNPKVAASWVLEAQTQGDATQCNGLVKDPSSEIIYEARTSDIKNKQLMWAEIWVNATHAWAPKNGNSNGMQLPFEIMSNPDFKSFGCAFSPICYQNTDEESYQLYCAFSKNEPLAKRGQIHGASLRTIAPYDLNVAAQLFFTELRNDTNATGLAGDTCILELSPKAEFLAGTLAQECTDEPTPGINDIVFTTNADIAGNVSTLYPLMTNRAFDAWKRQKGTNDQSDYLKIVDSSIESFGCAWSGRCQPPDHGPEMNGPKVYYLHCVLEASTTSPPSTTVPLVACDTRAELQVRAIAAVPTMDPKKAEGDAKKAGKDWDFYTDVAKRLTALRLDAGIQDPIAQVMHQRPLDGQAWTDATSCNGNRPGPYDEAVFKVIVSVSTPSVGWIEGQHNGVRHVGCAEGL